MSLPREQAHAVTAPAPRFDPHERPHGARDSRAYRAREPVHQHPEIDCVRSLLPPGIAEAAEHRADRIGVGADRVLIAAGRLSEDRYVTALSAYLGIPFEPLETMPRHASMLSDERLPAAAAAGLLPLRLSSDFVWVVAPRGVAARRLIGLVRLHPALRERLRLTTAARITRFANRHGSRSVGLLAADGLRTAKPQFSAATRSRFHPLLLAAAVIRHLRRDCSGD